jgi:hypothetical protein
MAKGDGVNKVPTWWPQQRRGDGLDLFTFVRSEQDGGRMERTARPG